MQILKRLRYPSNTSALSDPDRTHSKPKFAQLVRSIDIGFNHEETPHDRDPILHTLKSITNVRTVQISRTCTPKGYGKLVIPRGAWDGCFQQVTTLSCELSLSVVENFRMEELRLPSLLYFSFESIFEMTLAVDADRSPGDILKKHLLPFICNHASQLRGLTIKLTNREYNYISRICSALPDFPALEKLCLYGGWEPQGPPESGTAVHAFLAKHMAALEELAISAFAGSGIFSRSPSVWKRSAPDTQLPMTSLKLSVDFEMNSDFFSYLSAAFSQLREMWISKASFSSENLHQVSNIAKQCSESKVIDLLLQLDAISSTSLLSLSEIFPRLRVLRLIYWERPVTENGSDIDPFEEVGMRFPRGDRLLTFTL